MSKRCDDLNYQSRGFEIQEISRKNVLSDIETGPCCPYQQSMKRLHLTTSHSLHITLIQWPFHSQSSVLNHIGWCFRIFFSVSHCVLCKKELIFVFVILIQIFSCLPFKVLYDNGFAQTGEKQLSAAMIILINDNTKCQDYVYVKWEYWSTM